MITRKVPRKVSENAKLILFVWKVHKSKMSDLENLRIEVVLTELKTHFLSQMSGYIAQLKRLQVLRLA